MGLWRRADVCLVWAVVELGLERNEDTRELCSKLISDLYGKKIIGEWGGWGELWCGMSAHTLPLLLPVCMQATRR